MDLGQTDEWSTGRPPLAEEVNGDNSDVSDTIRSFSNNLTNGLHLHINDCRQNGDIATGETPDDTTNNNHDTWRIALYYIYVKMSNDQVQKNIQFQLEICEKYRLFGRVRISTEGINGVLSGRYKYLKVYEKHLIDALNSQNDIDGMNIVDEHSLDMKFCRLRTDLPVQSQLFDSLMVKKTANVINLFNEGDAQHLDKKKKSKSKSSRKSLARLEGSEQGHDEKNGNGLSRSHLQELHTSVMKQKTPVLSSSSHLDPDQWNRMLDEASPGSAVLLDVRNVYESKVGRFEHATTPTLLTNTRKYSDLISLLSPVNDKEGETQSRETHKALIECDKILMYCTGGVRCERVSFLVQELYPDKEVYQLKGGIQRYLEHTLGTNKDNGDGGRSKNELKIDNWSDTAAKTSNGTNSCYFQGKNFVFDPRRTDPIFRQGQDSSDCIVGRCIACGCAHDDYDNSHAPADGKESRCNTCRMLVLVCNDCRKKFVCHGECDDELGEIKRERLYCKLTHCDHEGSTPELQIVGGNIPTYL